MALVFQAFVRASIGWIWVTAFTIALFSIIVDHRKALVMLAPTSQRLVTSGSLRFARLSLFKLASNTNFVTVVTADETPAYISTSSQMRGSQKLFRIERILSNRGIGSRSTVASLLRKGKVNVDGKLVRSSAEKYPEDIIVEVDGKMSYPKSPMIAIYKPLGMHCTMSDPLHRRCLQELFRSKSAAAQLEGYHQVGRLDADTTGLLLFSRNGDLTERLLHPDNGVEREYEAIVVGTVEFNSLSQELAQGVHTAFGNIPAKLVAAKVLTDESSRRIVEILSTEQAVANLRQNDELLQIQFRHMQPNLIASRSNVSVVRLIVGEGKHRMVRRLLHNSGHSVLALHRIRYGPFSLSPGLLEDSGLEWGDQVEKKIAANAWPIAVKHRQQSFVLPFLDGIASKPTTTLGILWEHGKKNKVPLTSSIIHWAQSLLKSSHTSIKPPVPNDDISTEVTSQQSKSNVIQQEVIVAIKPIVGKAIGKQRDKTIEQQVLRLFGGMPNAKD
jgi:23S rRNA pseudouridine2605 synthase